MEQKADANDMPVKSEHREPLLMKSKLRVQKHGEVFTPQWVVDKMIAIPGVKEKAEDVFATFLEPSAGEGAFLLAIENAKLQSVVKNHRREMWNAYALWALTSIYGIEYLEDNLIAARQNMLLLFAGFLELAHGAKPLEDSDVCKSARTIIWANIVQGNTLTRKNRQGEEIVFSRWQQAPGSEHMVRRSLFTYSSLFDENDTDAAYVQGSLFDLFEQPKAESSQPQYLTVDIEQVWRKEKENG
jgi:hypothetical protein